LPPGLAGRGGPVLGRFRTGNLRSGPQYDQKQEHAADQQGPEPGPTPQARIVLCSNQCWYSSFESNRWMKSALAEKAGPEADYVS
jgi:hypothetical protein